MLSRKRFFSGEPVHSDSLPPPVKCSKRDHEQYMGDVSHMTLKMSILMILVVGEFTVALSQLTREWEKVGKTYS